MFTEAKEHQKAILMILNTAIHKYVFQYLRHHNHRFDA